MGIIYIHYRFITGFCIANGRFTGSYADEKHRNFTISDDFVWAVGQCPMAFLRLFDLWHLHDGKYCAKMDFQLVIVIF